MTHSETHEDWIKLVSLHKHWVTADSVNHHLRQSTRSGPAGDASLPKDMRAFAQHMSVFAAIGVWYALLQVVVEGYQALGCRDEAIDALLAHEEHAKALRRFRNATFHYQPDPLSTKLLDFIVAADSETWVHQLNRAFCSFFETRLNIKAMMESLHDLPGTKSCDEKSSGV